MHSLVVVLRESLDSLSQFVLVDFKLVELFSMLVLLVILELVFDLLQLTFIDWEDVTLPLPIQVSFAVVFVLVVDTTGTYLLVDNRNWLQTVR